jgi:hypothetical protein
MKKTKNKIGSKVCPASRCSALLGAYVKILKLSVLNFAIQNNMANARAKGMYEAAEIIRTMDSSLPAANLKYLRSLRRAAPHPTHGSLSRFEQHHLRLALGLNNRRKSQSHQTNANEAAILSLLGQLPKRKS